MRFGSLFSGIGGLDLGLERAGMECVWQVEIDEYATRVLAKHWPDVRRWDDIRTFITDDYGDQLRDESRRCSRASRPNSTLIASYGEEWNVDLICGGFPCQDISFAGKGAGLAGKRSGLFYELIRVVRELGPKYVLLENVAALLPRGIDQILGTLASIGFDAEWHCIPAATFGAPHIRDRVFIIAYLPDTLRSDCEPGAGRRGIRESHPQLANSEGQRFGTGRTGRTSASTEVRHTTSRVGAGVIGRKESTSRLERSGWWAAEPDVGRMAHGVPHRVDRLRGLGNAVVPQVAEWIGRQIMEFENRIPN